MRNGKSFCFFLFTKRRFLLPVLLAIPAAYAGMHLVGALGVIPYAGLAGILAMAWSTARAQLLGQTAVAAAAIGAGNALLLPIGVPLALGRPELVGPMLLGAGLALLVDAALAARLFGSKAMPTDAAWPQGRAGAAAIRVTDGGWPLAFGVLLGAAGAVYRAPMMAVGLAFLASPWPLMAFAAGLLLRGHGDWLPMGWLPGGDLMRGQVPQGLMLGAGLAAVVQMRAVWRVLAGGLAAHLAIAAVLAVAGGLVAGMPAGMLALFVVYAAAAALLHGVVGGMAALHGGWFPGLALALMAVTGGLLLGFPPAALALLAGFTAATGPGYVALGHGMASARAAGLPMRGVVGAGVAGFAVAGLVVWWGHGALFAAGGMPPMGHVYAIAIRAGAPPGAGMALLQWAAVGAAIQVLGGARRQLGVMLAAGLLLYHPAAGWAVLVGLGLRWGPLRRMQPENMRAFGAGMVAGDMLGAAPEAVHKAWRG